MVYAKIVHSQQELWEEFFKLRSEIKILEKGNEVLEKANSDYDWNRKVF